MSADDPKGTEYPLAQRLIPDGSHRHPERRDKEQAMAERNRQKMLSIVRAFLQDVVNEANNELTHLHQFREEYRANYYIKEVAYWEGIVRTCTWLISTRLSPSKGKRKPNSTE